MKYIARNILVSSVSALLLTSGAAVAETEINIAGWGVKSGPLRSFGINSEAVMSAAVERVNQMGGVKLADGSMAKLTFNYSDSACNAEQAIAVARKEAADGKSLIGIGPTCSGAAAAMYGVFQKQVDDASDTGLQYPILTDTAVRNGLAKISQWTQKSCYRVLKKSNGKRKSLPVSEI